MKAEEIQNIFASDVKGNPIYIEDAISGRKGYFCLGCDREMQAVKSLIRGRKSYFRHDVEANKTKGKCTYSDETYRHKLAKEALQLSKRIKVPAILKYHPINQGDALLIKPSHYIEAHSVSIELAFYETDNGEVKWGKDIGEGQNLLIKPDVTFFDKKGQPILLIEIVATHKLTEDKIILMRRLGIDTVSVTIPKDSPEAITQTFEETSRTKWIYNYEQETAQYILLSDSDAEAVPFIDEQQRRDFKITLKCRQAEIGDLIRRIGRCLESEQYRTIDESNRRELQRVKENADELLRDIERKAERNTGTLSTAEELEITEYRNSRRRNQEVISEIGLNQYKSENRYRELEERYFRKREELSREQKQVDGDYTKHVQSRGRKERVFNDSRSQLEKETIRVGDAIRKAERTISDATEISSDGGRNQEERASRSRALKEREFSRGKAIKEQIERDIARELENRAKSYKRIEDRGSDFEKQYEDFCRSTIEAIERADYNGIPVLTEGHKTMLSTRGLLYDYSEKQRIEKRYRSIREFLISGSFKIWMPKS